jgi:hypothetical protein
VDEITAATVTDILVGGASSFALPGTLDVAGYSFGAVTVVTTPAGAAVTPVTLGGTDAARFVITNGGILPCEVKIGAAPLPPAQYSFTLTTEPIAAASFGASGFGAEAFGRV